MKFPKILGGVRGWSDWISPTPKGTYKMACCDCGLVHDMQFKAIRVTAKRGGWWTDEGPVEEPHRVLFRARRNDRLSASLRDQTEGEP